MMGTELDVEGGEFLAEELGILDVAKVVAPPDQEEDLHVEDYEEDDVGQGGQDEEQIAALDGGRGTSEPIMYWMWFIVCEKSSMLHSDSVSSDIFEENTKLGASIIFTSLYPARICNPTTALTNRL